MLVTQCGKIPGKPVQEEHISTPTQGSWENGLTLERHWKRGKATVEHACVGTQNDSEVKQ